MKATVQEINLEGIDREKARQIRNEIKKMGNDVHIFKPDEYPALNELDKILSGLFNSMKHNVHFISKREEV